VVTLKTFEQIIPPKLGANSTTTLSPYYLGVYGLWFNRTKVNNLLFVALTHVLIQGALTEGEGSAQLTSSFKVGCVVKSKNIVSG
jgi:hypothetical protein